MNDDIEEMLARLKPKGIEAELRPRVLAAVASELTPRGKTAACNHPAGHQFICVHCGGEVQPASLVRRLSWPGALAAMTSIAATLLVVMLTNRPAEVADREGRSRATGPAIAAGPTAPPVKSIDRSADRDRFASAFDRNLWRRLASSGQSDAQGILLAGDTELYDELASRSSPRANGNAVSIVDIESADEQLRNGELLERFLRESGVSSSGSDRSMFPPSDLPGSRL